MHVFSTCIFYHVKCPNRFIIPQTPFSFSVTTSRKILDVVYTRVFRAYNFFCYLIGYKFCKRKFSLNVKQIGIHRCSKQFLFFRHGSAFVKIFLVYGIYYAHGLAIYGHIFSSKYRFILNLLNSLIRFFMKKMSAIRQKV